MNFSTTVPFAVVMYKMYMPGDSGDTFLYLLHEVVAETMSCIHAGSTGDATRYGLLA